MADPTTSSRRRNPRLTLLLTGLIALAGCSSATYLMPTPNLYTDPSWNPFEEVPPSLQGDKIAVLFVTDRTPEKETPGQLEYGTGRSRSAAFGEAVVQIGDRLSWEEIVRASRATKRERALELKLTTTREIARFGKTPPTLALNDAQMDSRATPPVDPATAEAELRFRNELAARLAQTPRKEVFLYVHGFNNSFEEGVLTTAELWHFLGREGVPISYSWPAGMGAIKSYFYTLVSTNFTIYHFKQTLRRIASLPEVEKVHILAHSRGTAVTTDALRELHLEMRGTTDTQKALKLGTVVLAAADLDLDATIARNASERIVHAVERTVVYTSDEDKALGFSSWLFGGERLGEIDDSILEKAEVTAVRGSRRLQLIKARVKDRGSFGHSYYTANPAVSSDIVLAIRFQLPPGREHGRPLGVSEDGLWIVDDDYPGRDWKPPPPAPAE